MKTILDVNRENDFIPNGDWEYEEGFMEYFIFLENIKYIFEEPPLKESKTKAILTEDKDGFVHPTQHYRV